MKAKTIDEFCGKPKGSFKKFVEKSQQEDRKMTELGKFKRLLNTFGFMIPENAEFYKVLESGKIGMKVGGFEHSCHVESSNIVILLHFKGDLNENDRGAYIEEYWGCWDLKRI
jgi:hypothetical protein